MEAIINAVVKGLRDAKQAQDAGQLPGKHDYDVALFVVTALKSAGFKVVRAPRRKGGAK